MASLQLHLASPDEEIAQLLERAVLRPAGFEVTYARDRQTVEALLGTGPPDGLMIREPLTDGVPGSGLELAARLLEEYPALPVILFTIGPAETLALEALRLGVMDILTPPLRPQEVLHAIRRALRRRQRLAEWAHRQDGLNTKSLQKRVSDLEALQGIGRKVTASLDLDSVLAAVVEAAVLLTGAEESSLLLLDEGSGELYMRAGRNFQEEFVRTFRLPVDDTLAGQVLRSGKPVILDGATPHKIKTAYLVHNLMYAPLMLQGRAIGLLSVDHRQGGGGPFTDYHLSLVSALADYAAIAIENARLFAHSELERSKLEGVLTRIQDGVIVVDLEGRLMLVNPAAGAMFGVEVEQVLGRPASDALLQPDLLEMLRWQDRPSPYRSEVGLEDGRVFNAQATPIPGVGLAIILQEITHLKELDRIKSDFVNTVSHDLRSPLTAILGYVELIDRVGPVTAQQSEFIRRVQANVHNITALINDLLDLGRIEAGFDSRKEKIHLTEIIGQTLDSLRSRITEKDQALVVNIPEALPAVLGNPVRLRQMLSNLIDNAIKYTPSYGRISLTAETEDGQVILQVADTGPGIPLADQPYIFDKFYRASNVPLTTPGTGLGLAIVKSIVDNHQGRIWVESVPSRGSTFTVVLPIEN